MNLRITENIEEANLVTHDSKFHPDDVFSTAFMSKLIENPVVYRASVKGVPTTNAIVYDVGFGRFDHHGPDAALAENGIKYCSFGLLWEEYGKEYLEKINAEDIDKLFNRVKKTLVEQINGIDNGIFPKIISPYKLLDLDAIIDLFNNTWDEETDNSDNFLSAVNIASTIFDLVVKKESSLIKSERIVEKALNNVQNHILILDHYMPYSDTIFDSINPLAKEVKIVILPSNRGGYNIKPMTINKESKELLINFPKEYFGLHGEELQKLSKIPSAVFVHANGFLACTETLDDAITLAKEAIDNS